MDWERRGLRREHLDALRRAGLDMAVFEQPSVCLARRPEGVQLHLPTCPALRASEVIEEVLSAAELAEADLHVPCTRWDNPLPFAVSRWLTPGLAVAAVLELLDALEASPIVDLDVLAGLVAYRPRLEAHLDELTGRLDGELAFAEPALLSATAAEAIRRRVDDTLARAEVDPGAQVLALAALELGEVAPARSRSAAGARPGTGSGRLIAELYRSWVAALSEGAGYTGAASAVAGAYSVALAGQGHESSNGALGLDLSALCRYWQTELGARLDEGSATVLIGVRGGARSGGAERMCAGLACWQLEARPDGSRDAVVAAPELVAEHIVAAHPESVVWFGPAGDQVSQLAELVASLWDGSTDTSCFAPATVLAACSAEPG